MTTTFSPEVQAILDRVKSGAEPPPKAPKRKRRVLTPEEKAEREAAKAARVRRQPLTETEKVQMRRYNYNLIVELFTTLGMNVTEIAEYVGCSRSVVTNALNWANVPMEDRQIARKPKEMCKRGLHDLEEHAVVLSSSGLRTCQPCKVRVARIARWRREGKQIPQEDLAFLEMNA